MSYFTTLQQWRPDQVTQHLKTINDDPMLRRYFKRMLAMTKHSEQVGEVLTVGQLESLWQSMFSRAASGEQKKAGPPKGKSQAKSTARRALHV